MKKFLFVVFCLSICCSVSSQTRPSILDVQSLENIASLRSTVPSVSKNYIAIIDGYTTRGDGGGGKFTWDGTSTEDDDGGRVIKPTPITGAGRWIRECNPTVVNVRHYGAMGNCVTTEVDYVPADHSEGHVSSYTGKIHEFSGTDDTLAFQRAYSSVDSGDTLYIPSGNYFINGNSSSWVTSNLRPGMSFAEKENITIRGDGTSSKISVSYDCAGASTASSTFVLFQFLGCKNIQVCNLNIDYQAIGWPGTQVSGDDTDTRLMGSIFFSHFDGTTPAENCVAESVSMRTHHPWGMYFGDSYTAGKYAGKLISIFIEGNIAAVPTTLTMIPGASDVMAKNCAVRNCIFYDSHPYPVFLWMTEFTDISHNDFTGHGDALPAVRAVQLNRFVNIESNRFSLEPNYKNGGSEVYGVYISNDNQFWLPNNININNNYFEVDRTEFGGISVFGGSEIAIKDNFLVGKDVDFTPGFHGAITVSPASGWAVFGDKGQTGNVQIIGNIIRGFDNGIMARAARLSISKNDISQIKNYAIYGCPIAQSYTSCNQINGAAVGVYTPRVMLNATGSMFVNENSINSCDIGILGEFLASGTSFYFNNSVTNCATGTAALYVPTDRLWNCYYENNVVDLSPEVLLVASEAISIGAGSIRGNSSGGF